MTVARFFEGWRYREMGIVLALAFASIILWRVSIVGLLFYPFHLFGTFVHELCHGLAAILTGGEFRRFIVNPNLSGLAWSAGGIRWIVIMAGYLGNALFGGLLVVISAWGLPSRQVLFWLGIVLGVLCLLFVRNLFGVVSGLLLAAGLVLAGRRLDDFWANALLMFLAVQSMLNAINSVFDLVKITTSVGGQYGHNDAMSMQKITMIPAPVWAVLWSMVSLGILVGSLILAYRRST